MACYETGILTPKTGKLLISLRYFLLRKTNSLIILDYL
jgi:hypothetical protein